jgi:hypothetical protein
MARVPTIAEEDAKRPNRERECLVEERTRLANRMKGALARLGIRNFKPTLRQAAELKLILDMPHFSDVARSGDYKCLAVVPLRDENKQYVDRPCDAGHGAPCDVALVLTGPQTGPHMPEWQLSLLKAQHLFEPAPDYLIPRQAIGAFSSGIQVFVDKRAIFARPEQCQPIR